MLKHLATACISLWCLALAACHAADSGASVPLVREGKTAADIVIATNASSVVRYAAGELQHFIAKMTGAELPIVTAPTEAAAHVFVGRSGHTAERGVETRDLAPDGYRVVARDNWVTLVGNDFEGEAPPIQIGYPYKRGHIYNPELNLWAFGEAGSLFAVYDLLRDQGCRWYMPGELGEVVPERPSLTIPQGTKQVAPNYHYRYPYLCRFERSARDAQWFRRIGCGAPRPVFVNHTLQAVAARQAESRPDWLVMIDGERQTDGGSHGYKPCLSADGFFDATVAYVRAFFDKRPLLDTYAVMPTDGYKGCYCERCLPRRTPERGQEGEVSDYVWGFVNRVAIEIKKSHPDRRVSCCAYSRYLLPPTKIDLLSDNLIVVMCQTRAHMFDPAYRKLIRDARRGWQRVVPHREFYVWEYYLTNRYRRLYGLPGFFTEWVDRDLKSLQDFASGEFVECNKGPNKNLVDPLLNNFNLYLTARLYWDPGLDAGALKREYLDLFFGPAAGPMARFYAEAERIWMKPVSTGKRYRGGLRQLITENEVAGLFAILDGAAKQAPEGVYAERVEAMRKDCTPLRSLYGAPPVDDRPLLRVASMRRRLAEGAPRIDGRLDETFWQTVEPLRLVDNRTGADPSRTTRFRTVRTDTALILGIECEEPAMGRLRMGTTGHDDKAIWRDDNVEVFVSTPVNDCYQFTVNPAGATSDMNWDGAESFSEAVAWNSGMRAAVTRDTARWTIELSIPRLALDPRKGLRPTAERPWRINVYRTALGATGAPTHYAWSPTLGKTYRNRHMFGVLVFE